MEGEREFNIKIEIPTDVSKELNELTADFISENDKEVSNLFNELLSIKRAAFMIEIASPIRVVKAVDELLRGAGYQVFISMDFEPVDEIKNDLEKEYPDDVIIAAAVYVSLHEAFIEIARLADAGVMYPVLSGLMFGYRVKNIIGFLEQKRDEE